MIVAVMQPYFFPYIGYFQLMQAVNTFVFYDDVQFIKRGWVNRNRILLGNQPSWLTLPVKHDNQTVNINRRSYLLDEGVKHAKGKLQSAYASAPGFRKIYPFLSDILDFGNHNVAEFNVNLLRRMAQQLGINCRFCTSSGIAQPEGLRGEAKIIYLCEALGADHYINPIGGVELYDPAAFADAGITLSFLRTTTPPTLTQSGPQHLSVIDGLMRAGFDGCRLRLPEYSLLSKDDLRTHA